LILKPKVAREALHQKRKNLKPHLQVKLSKRLSSRSKKKRLKKNAFVWKLRRLSRPD